MVQRASLIHFQNLAMKLSEGLETCGKCIDTRRKAMLMDLQERFIAFQNQINFQEVSSQEQSVELYQMLRKANFVEELNQTIKDQMDALYDATNTNQDFTFNKWACILALIALGIDIPTFLFDASGNFFWNRTGMAPSNLTFWISLFPHVLILFVTGLLIFMVSRKFSRKGKN